MSYHRPIAHAAATPASPLVSPPPGRKLSPRARLAVICGLAAGLWVPIIVAARAVFG